MPLARRDQILFNPGPVNLDPAVKENLFNLELCHRQPEFAELKAAIERRLFAAADLSPAEHALALMPGGGSLAVDAALATFVEGRALVLDNGVYGARLSDSLHALETGSVALRVSPGAAIRPEDVEAAIERTAADWIAVVHHETSTGQLNPLADIAELAARHGCRLLVDAVSSLGAHTVDSRADVICFSSGKCLEAMPGIGGVFFRRDLAANATIPTLDVTRYGEGIPTTPNVQAYVALDVALDLLIAEDRAARYRGLAERVWHAGAQTFRPFLAEAERSHVLTAFHLDGRPVEDLLDRALASGYVIYGGQGELRDEIFRVANMGAAIDENRIDDLFRVLAT